jgi:hypothetical protein
MPSSDRRLTPDETYDAIVDGEQPATPESPRDEMVVDPQEHNVGVHIEDAPPGLAWSRVPQTPEARAERDVAAEVRRRERRK